MKQKRIVRSLFSLFAMVMVLTVLLVSGDAQAATKAKIDSYSKKIEIGVNGTANINLYDTVPKAKYTYKSSKTSVAKVDKNGKVTGVSLGTAKITVTQTLKKKSVKVGTVTVKVKKAVIPKSESSNGAYVSLTSQPGYWEKNPSNMLGYVVDYYSGVMLYQNPKATYTLISNDPDTLKIDKKGNVLYVAPYADKDVKITVKETYKKKTVTIGTFNTRLYPPEFTGKTSYELAKNDKMHISETVSWVSFDDCWCIVTDDADYMATDDSFVKLESDSQVLSLVTDSESGEWHGDLKAANEGTVYVYVYVKNFLTDKYETTPLGKFTVTVKDYPEAYDIKTEFESDTFQMDLDDEWRATYVYLNPVKYTGDLTVTSSNPDVVSVELDRYDYTEDYDEDDYGRFGWLKFYAHHSGTADVTISANGASHTIKVTITDEWGYEDED